MIPSVVARQVEEWGRLLGDTSAVTAMLDRLLHHGHVLECGPKSWRARTQPSLHKEAAKRQKRRTLARSAAHASRLALAALLRSSAVLADAVLETARALERGSVERGQFRAGE